jgi:hypothetical protein
MLQKSTILKKCFFWRRLNCITIPWYRLVNVKSKKEEIFTFLGMTHTHPHTHTHTLSYTHTHTFFLPHSHVCKVCRKTFNDNNLIINQGHKKHFIALDLIQLTKTFTDCNFKNICKLWKTLLALFFVTFMCNVKFLIYFFGTDPFQLSF